MPLEHLALQHPDAHAPSYPLWRLALSPRNTSQKQLLSRMEDTTTSAPAPAAHTKQYVFVDEYNRHKRLKVMRACDGCRKRKIRCDGALQNGPWPCGACVRLKLKCIPPTLDQDDDSHPPNGTTGQQTFPFQNTTFPATIPVDSKSTGLHTEPRMVHDWSNNVPPATTTGALTSAPSYQLDYASNAYSHQPIARLTQPGYPQDSYYSTTSQYQQGSHESSLSRTCRETPESSSGDAQEIEAGVRELSSHMGDLQIDITSAAPYITRTQMAPDAPALEEAEVVLPASIMADASIRIPPEMMPSEERATYFFNYYFDHIHPYCPVLHRATFLEQWRSNRHSMSPLLLEAIFACVARYLEQPVESRKWLALAARHEESFKDVPRLETIQAMIILMKARESISKRGYYYRSWMAVKYMTTCGIDLRLDVHHEQHQTMNRCSYDRIECMLRTRIWQTLFVLEILTGAPLGRSDFSIDIDTVQYTMPLPTNDIDAFEHLSSRRSTILAQNVRNIKQSNILWQTMKRYKKDWALDPAFVQHNEDLPVWAETLPNDFQLQYADDGSPPWLGADHFKAYVHVYHHLTVIMHHRPQLQALLAKGDPGWKAQLDICLSSASLMCRTQEALYRDFQFHGLQFMIRGVNFTIYCVLTCMMLHLVCPAPLLLLIPSLTQEVGCNHLSRSCTELASTTLLHKAHAGSGALHHVRQCGDAGSNQHSSRSVQCRCYPAIRAQAYARAPKSNYGESAHTIEHQIRSCELTSAHAAFVEYGRNGSLEPTRSGRWICHSL